MISCLGESRLVNLQEVVLSHSLMEAVSPLGLRGLHNLVRLDLSHNRLAAVPALGLAAQLRDLSLAANPLGRLEDAAFLGLGELIRLDLSGCSLVAVATRAFASLHSLQQLDLRYELKGTVQRDSFG